MATSIRWVRLFNQALLAGAVLLALPYAFGPIYRFPDTGAFSGPRIWNPYADLAGTWQRANLHAHGRAWSGLTNGVQPSAEVEARYRSMGYSVPGISNYQAITRLGSSPTVPLYEHGYNVGKHHQLAIGAREVDWFDFPLWQSIHHLQYVIDRVARKSELVGLNHPNSRDAYGNQALRVLTGYQLIEVANGPFTAEELWDEALSSGHPVWGMANDDSHDLEDLERRAVGWTMINAPTPSRDDILPALKMGRSYAVLRTGAIDAGGITRLESVEVHGDTLRVAIAGAPAHIAFVGQGGSIRKRVKDALHAEYTLSGGDTYVRTVITSPQTVLYLNPVIRWDGQHLTPPAATVDFAWTWTFRGALALCCALAVVGVRFRHVAGRTPARDVLVTGE
ncbi:MAG: hypothetical protein AB7Q29_09520 [Vicinamibacterales bacterium]